MKFTKRSVAGIAIVGALTAGATIPALAQDADTQSETSEQDQAERPFAEQRAEREERRQERRAEFTERVAELVGVDADDLAAAMEQVHEEMKAEHDAERLALLEERLADAVAEGELSQEEADEILARAEDGDFPRPRHHRRGGPRPGGPGGDPGFGPGPDGPSSDGAEA